MTKMIDYSDNVFFIIERTKLLETGMTLALVPALFSERFLKDADFISKSLVYIRKKINNSPHSLKRPDNLRSLMLANQRLAQILPLLIDRGYLGAEIGNNMRSFHETQVLEIEKNLSTFQQGDGESEQVSSQEFEFLLKAHGN